MTTFTNNTAPGNEHAIVGVADKGIGVHGTSKTSTGTGGVSDSGIGVHGVSTAGPGVRGDAEKGIGVFGRSKTGVGVSGDSETWQGVYGHSTGNAGVVGDSKDFHGVFGICQNASFGGVYGTNNTGFGVIGESQFNIGVSGSSKDGEGVRGETNSPSAAAIAGYNIRIDGNGAAIYGKKHGGTGYAGFFEGNVEVTGSLKVKGRGVLVDQRTDQLYAGSRDYVERRPVTIQVHNRHITAEVALVHIDVMGNDRVLVSADGFFAQVGIAQIVSDRGVEEWRDQLVTSIERRDVTSITFYAEAALCRIFGRWSISYWS